jgi:hypothetical protein
MRKQEILYAMKLNAIAIKNNEIETVEGFKNIIALCNFSRDLGMPISEEEYRTSVTYNMF